MRRLFSILLATVFLFPLSSAIESRAGSAGEFERLQAVRQDLTELPPIWEMERGEIDDFCRAELERKRRDLEAAERELERSLGRLLAAAPSEGEAAKIKQEQAAWAALRRQKADEYFWAQENLDEQEQADTHATCYPQKSLNRASYDLITAKSRAQELEARLVALEVGVTVPTSAGGEFVGVYGNLWLPVGYLLVNIRESVAAGENFFELTLQAETTRPRASGSSCQMRLNGRYRNGFLEFQDPQQKDFLVRALWNENRSGIILLAVEADDPSKEYAGNESVYYCGAGLSFTGEYYRLTSD